MTTDLKVETHDQFTWLDQLLELASTLSERTEMVAKALELGFTETQAVGAWVTVKSGW